MLVVLRRFILWLKALSDEPDNMLSNKAIVVRNLAVSTSSGQ